MNGSTDASPTPRGGGSAPTGLSISDTLPSYINISSDGYPVGGSNTATATNPEISGQMSVSVTSKSIGLPAEGLPGSIEYAPDIASSTKIKRTQYAGHQMSTEEGGQALGEPTGASNYVTAKTSINIAIDPTKQTLPQLASVDNVK